MAELDENIAQALKVDMIVDITTTGRKSGDPRRIEIWSHYLDGQMLIAAAPGRRSWYANLRANPEFTFRLEESIEVDLPARARVVTDEEDRRAILTSVAARWYRDRSDVERLVADAPLVEVTFLDHP